MKLGNRPFHFHLYKQFLVFHLPVINSGYKPKREHLLLEMKSNALPDKLHTVICTALLASVECTNCIPCLNKWQKISSLFSSAATEICVNKHARRYPLKHPGGSADLEHFAVYRTERCRAALLFSLQLSLPLAAHNAPSAASLWLPYWAPKRAIYCYSCILISSHWLFITDSDTEAIIANYDSWNFSN